MHDVISGYDSVSAAINKTIAGLKAHPKILKEEKHKYMYPAFERAMYVAISAADLNVALKYLDVSNALKNHAEANFFARVVAHISYELINHKNKVVGSEVANLATSMLGEGGLLDIKEASADLKAVVREHHPTLNKIRNNLFGHRLENGSEMAAMMLELDNGEIYRIGKRVFTAYLKIIGAYSKLLTEL